MTKGEFGWFLLTAVVGGVVGAVIKETVQTLFGRLRAPGEAQRVEELRQAEVDREDRRQRQAVLEGRRDEALGELDRALAPVATFVVNLRTRLQYYEPDPQQPTTNVFGWWLEGRDQFDTLFAIWSRSKYLLVSDPESPLWDLIGIVLVSYSTVDAEVAVKLPTLAQLRSGTAPPPPEPDIPKTVGLLNTLHARTLEALDRTRRELADADREH